jgi:outer membrane receptor protein involved in Fe transport
MAYRRFWLAGAMFVVLPGVAFAQAQPAPADQPPTAAPSAAPPSAAPDTAKAPPAKPPAKSKAAAPPVKTIDEVTVTGLVPDEKSTIDSKSYTLSKDLQAATGSIADALRNVPAVEVDLQGNLSVRGDQNVTILVDGKPSPAFEGAGRADALQQLPADQIERVEVITNPSAALNPEGTGGVINLITKKSRGGGLTGSAYATASTAGLKRAGLNLGYNNKILAVTAAFSGNYQRNKDHDIDDRSGLDPTSGEFLRTLDQGLGRNITRGPTARVNVTLTPNDKDQFTGELSYVEQNVYGHPDDLYTDFGPTGTPTQIFDFHGHRRFYENANSASLGWRHSFAENETLSIDGVYNATIDRDHFFDTTTFTLPAGQTAPLQLFRNDGNVHHAELRVAYNRDLAGGSLKTGYEVRHEDNDYPYQVFEGPSETSVVPDASLTNHYLFKQTVQALYATYQHAFGALDVQGGLRLEDARFELDELTSGAKPTQHYERAYPTLHLAYKLDDDRKLSASYSVRVQRPRSILLEPLVIYDGPQDLQVGNPNLKPKETRSYELGYEQHAGSQSYEATFYYRQTKNDFAQLVTDQGNDIFLYSFGNLGRGQQVGADLTANGKFTSALSYSLGLSPYWNQIDAGPLQSSLGRRATYSASGRANLNWQADASDMVQLNAQESGRRLQAQGVISPVFTLNAGWRHIINDRITATLTAQDLLNTNRFHRELDTPTLVEHLFDRPVSRAILLRFDYRFGGGAAKAKAPDFDYGPGGGPG